MLEILIFTFKKITKLSILRYLGTCDVLYIWHVRVIPTYRVYRLYDKFLGIAARILSCYTPLKRFLSDVEDLRAPLNPCFAQDSTQLNHVETSV